MRATLWSLLAAAVLVGCGSAASAPTAPTAPAPETSLTITFWADETAAAKRWTLRCRPAGGTHTSARSTCSKLYALAAPFAPVPKDAVCTQVYGGPQRALVAGTDRGRRVWARLSLTDGCQIARFNRVAFLVPGFVVAAPGAGGSGGGG